MEHSQEELEYLSSTQSKQKDKQEFHERPVFQRLFSWFLIAIVIFAFLGSCYWLAFYEV